MCEQNPATHLGDLPVEVLVNIFGRMQYTPHLVSLSLSCKSFHDIVEPLLYRAYSRGGPWESYQRHTTGLQRLLLNILQRPKLAEYMRILAVDEIRSSEDVDGEGPWDGTLRLEECTISEQKLFLSAVHDLGDDIKKDNWLLALESGVSEVYFALLLTKFSNLEVLSFEDAIDKLPLFEIMRKHVKENNGKYLTKLTSLAIDTAPSEDRGFSLCPYDQLFVLPSLKEFNGRCVEEVNNQAESSAVSACSHFTALSPFRRPR
jgi:hypothetical protein